MSSDRRRAPQERRQTDRVPAVFAVKKAITGPEGRVEGHIQLCQAEDIAPAGMTIKRPRGSSVMPRTEIALSFALPGSDQEISARGLVVAGAMSSAWQS